MSKRRSLFLASLAVVVGCLGFGGLNSYADEAMLTIGSKAPSLDIENWVSDGKGKFKKVTDFESGKVYVVEFWATWCGPCIASMPHLAATQTAFADRNVQIISISDEDMDTVQTFLKREVPSANADDEEAEEGDDEPETKEEPKEEAKDEAKQTFGELTSVYCLTTDPDGSVNNDYMTASGQNGIPTCFIVGKSGQIEWIGHPMNMDEPLTSVVEDKWDRDAFATEFKKSQERDLLMTNIMGKVRSGKSKEALEMINDARAKAGDDQELQDTLDSLELNVLASPIIAKARGGDLEGAIAGLDEVSQSLSPKQKAQLIAFKLQLQLQAEQFEAAGTTLKQMAAAKDADPQMLNAIAWNIYEAAKSGEAKIPKELTDAAMVASEKAVELIPNNGAVLDTLARLVHLSGDLDRAIELETKAVADKSIQEPSLQKFLDELKQEKAEKK